MAIFGKNVDTRLRNFILIAIFIGVLLFVAIILLLSSGDFIVFQYVGSILKNLWWVIFPIPLWYAFLVAWYEYSEFKQLAAREYFLLEVKPPADIEKSPMLMEHVFAGLHTWSTPNKFEMHCGWRRLQDKYSFEIVSLGGVVHLYARGPLPTRDLMESMIYSQYPDAEIFEVEEYTNQLPKVLPNKDWDVWGTSLKLQKEDPIPIRTYRRLKEDVSGEMIDPMASLGEIMSSMSKNEFLGLQLIFTPQKENIWHDIGQKKIDELTKKAKKEVSPLEKFRTGFKDFIKNIFRGILGGELEFSSAGEEVTEEFNINKLTPGEQETLKALSDNISKESFYAAVRFIYVGERSIFNKARGVAGAMSAMKQIADVNLNSLVPDNRTKTYANYYFTESRLAYRQRKIVQDYKDRGFQNTEFSMSVEELATVFHFPDISVKTPALQRIEAKKGEAPFNLPISG